MVAFLCAPLRRYRQRRWQFLSLPADKRGPQAFNRWQNYGKLIPQWACEEVFVYLLQALIIFKLPNWSKGFG